MELIFLILLAKRFLSNIIELQELSGDDEFELDVKAFGSIPCSSVVTAILCCQGKLFVGYADKSVKVFASDVANGEIGNQYAYVLLKINKLGGMNSLLGVEHSFRSYHFQSFHLHS